MMKPGRRTSASQNSRRARRRIAAAWAAWAEASGVPVAAQFRRQDRIDNASPAYVGDLGLGCNPALEARVGE